MSGGTLSLDELLSPQLLVSVQDIPEIVPTPIAGSKTPPTEVGVGVQAPPAVTAAATPPLWQLCRMTSCRRLLKSNAIKVPRRRPKVTLANGTDGASQLERIESWMNFLMRTWTASLATSS